jgi:subtilisin family serine protease
VLKKVSTSSVLAAIAAGVWIWMQFGGSEAAHTGAFPGAQPASVQTVTGFVSPLEKHMSADSPASSDPVEAAVARGSVLDTRIKTEAPGQWTRTRLVRMPVQPSLVSVVERWSDESGVPVCLGREMFLPDRLLVRTAPQVNMETLQASIAPAGMLLANRIADNLWSVTLPASDLDAIPNALAYLSARPEIAVHAEPDGVGFGAATPNDTSFPLQWSLSNTGQLGGISGVDVSAFQFWELAESAPGITIAVIDSGLNFAHPDLQGIAWTTPGEVAGDGIDNDGNGRIDDIHGWDFVNGDNNPTDDHGHGSHVTGIIAATRNNGTGITGLIAGVRILVCKVLNSSNLGTTSDLISAVSYARSQGAPIMNLSLQSYPFSASLEQEFNGCEAAGILLVVCAGNQGKNNDTTPNYPSSYPHDNVIAVASHNAADKRASDSNYGGQNVDLYAPGVSIYSTVLGQAYANYSGTSMATPHVAAVCAAIKYANPSWDAADIKNAVLTSVTPAPAYDTFCLSGGRLDAAAALARACLEDPAQDSDADAFPNLLEYLAGTRVDSPLDQPVISTETSNNSLTISMPRVVRTDAYLEVQKSTDLVSWTTTGLTDSSTSETLIGTVSLSGLPRVFLRIKASPTP